MGSRGRGRGKASMSISTEQLGFSKGEALLPPVLQPPPKYPPLDHKPTSFTFTNELSYLLELKRGYAEYMRDSPNNVPPIVLKKDIERYSDRYQDMITDKTGYDARYDWSRLPAELKPVQRKRKSEPVAKIVKKAKNVDIESKLQELEKKEKTQENDDEEEKEGENEEKEGEEHVEEEEEEIDEEMDEGTDYLNNYFDNGEDYDDEEENLDDGPVF